MGRKKLLTVRTSEAAMRDLARAAEKAGMSKSTLVRKAVGRMIREIEEGGTADGAGGVSEGVVREAGA